MSTEESFNETYKYEIYVGLKDKDDYNEYLSVEDVMTCLYEYCKGKNIAFSVVNQVGGYAHNRGYVTETSVKLVLVGASFENVLSISEMLKKKVNTDTVMITREKTGFMMK